MWQDWIDAITALQAGEGRAAQREQGAYPEVVAYLDSPDRMLVRLIRLGARRSFVYHTRPDCPDLMTILRPAEAYDRSDLPDSGRPCEQCVKLNALPASGSDPG